jgi:hypothetical protein
VTGLLFTTYMAIMEKILKKAQAGGSVDFREKVWGVVFGDDLVIVAKSEREMKEMMSILGKNVKKKKLEINVEKRNMVVFNKRKTKGEENEWNWEGRKIEQVNEFKYFNERAHVRKIVRKANKNSKEKVGR